MKGEPGPEMMPPPAHLQSNLQSPMQQPLPQQMQSPMHAMQDMQPGPNMPQGLGGAPVANMGVMPGGVPSRPAGPSGLSNETIDEMKEEM